MNFIEIKNSNPIDNKRSKKYSMNSLNDKAKGRTKVFGRDMSG